LQYIWNEEEELNDEDVNDVLQFQLLYLGTAGATSKLKDSTDVKLLEAGFEHIRL
jgi:hypothetical protein